MLLSIMINHSAALPPPRQFFIKYTHCRLINLNVVVILLVVDAEHWQD